MPSTSPHPDADFSTSSYPRLDVRLLGTLEITYQPAAAAAPLALSLPPTVKSQSLLAYLILHTQPPSTRERLSALFWAERPPSRARRSLSTALWHIRRCFPVESLQTDARTVRFAFPGSVVVDVHTFEKRVAEDAPLDSLAQGVNLYRGDFLEDFYDDWALTLRYHLQSQYLDALTRLMRGYEARQLDRDALQTALRLLSVDPLSESACQTALRAYSRLGQREAALKLYHRFAAALRRELDIEPAPETAALYQSLVRNADAAKEKEEEARAPLHFPALESSSPLPSWLSISSDPPLVGRENALQELRRAWEKASARQFHSVWICGEAGIGKTRLAEVFAREVKSRGGNVLWGRCTQWENEPYAPLSDVLRAALDGREQHIAKQLSPWQKSALIQLLPELKDSFALETPPEETLLTGDPRLLLRALARLLSVVVRGVPTVIVLEDLHWASPDVLTWLPMLAKETAANSLLLVGICRREEIPENSPLQTLIWQWQSEARADTIDLTPLSLENLSDWLPHAPPKLLHALHHHTGGNPFFVLETLRSLVDGGQLDVTVHPFAWHSEGTLPIPDTVRQAVRLRREQLPASARQALEVAAVLGKDFDMETWQLALGVKEEELLSALDALLRRGWIVEGRGPFALDYTFNHPVTREVIYQGLTAARKRALHLRAARALSQLPEKEQRHAAIASHYFQAEAWEKAWPRLLRAGDRAAKLAAGAEALTCYLQARQARQKAEDAHRDPLYDAALSRKIGDVYFQRGEYKSADQYLLEALSRLGRPLPQGTWKIRAALVFALLKQPGRKLFPFFRRKATHQERSRLEEEVAAYTTLGWMYTLEGRAEAYLLVSLRALNAAQRGNIPGGEAVASTALGIAADFTRLFGVAERLHRRALNLLPQLTRPDEVGFVHFGAAYHALLTAEEERLLHHTTQSVEAYQRAGMPQRWALAMLMEGYVWLYRGDLDRAESIAETLRRTGEELDAPSALSSGHAIQGYIARWRGEREKAAESFYQAAILAKQAPDYMAEVENLGEAARCQMRLNRRDDALEMLHRAQRIAKEQEVSGDSLVRLRVAEADIALLQARLALEEKRAVHWREVQQTLRRARRATRAFRPARPELCLLLGRLAYLRGDRAKARRWWQRGLTLAQRYGHALEEAALALEAGTALDDSALAQQGRAFLKDRGAIFEPETPHSSST